MSAEPDGRRRPDSYSNPQRHSGEHHQHSYPNAGHDSNRVAGPIGSQPTGEPRQGKGSGGSTPKSETDNASQCKSSDGERGIIRKMHAQMLPGFRAACHWPAVQGGGV